MRDLKYLISFISPLSVWVALSYGGWASFSTFYLAFIIIPLLEFFMPCDERNLTSEDEKIQMRKKVFDWQLYINIPILFALLLYFFFTVSGNHLLWWELAGMSLSTGIMLGFGINVAHELGHRHNKVDQFLSKLLLIPPLYMHFFIEHNLGHHKHVSTDRDPASSRLHENIYAFFIRSSVMGYLHAWQIERKRLKKSNIPFWSFRNQMIRFQMITLLYLVLVGVLFSWKVLMLAVIAGIIGFLLLESVNYIEHYGLRRRKISQDHYEPVQPYHSWNSNHEVGRIFLYELTRHSDHHFKSSRKYQVLRHFDESPQLPLGYPGSILMALFPPLWFRVMNPEVKKVQEQLMGKLEVAA